MLQALPNSLLSSPAHPSPLARSALLSGLDFVIPAAPPLTFLLVLM